MTAQVQSFSQMVKVSGFQLAPFFKGTILYLIFYKFNFYDSNLLSTILKCAPIFSLMNFLLMNDFKEPRQTRHKKLLLGALFFSLVGDILLDYKAGGMDSFAIGMLSFAIAQIIYIITFGFDPLKPLIGLLLYIIGGCTIALVFKNFTDIFIVAVPLYSILLETMVWRAFARIKNTQSLPQVFCAIGGLAFIISDGCILINLFYTPIPNAQFYIIFTYYLAQLGLTLSILDVDSAEGSKKKK